MYNRNQNVPNYSRVQVSMPAMFACIDSTLPITLAEQKLTQTHTKANEFPKQVLKTALY